MRKIFLAVKMGLLILLVSGCQTVKGTVDGAVAGMDKDMINAGAVVCKTCQTVGDAFAQGDSEKPRGAVYKADDWVQDHLW